MGDYQLSDWLPTTRKEMDIRGWDQADVILFSGDAYIDHPSFGAAVIGRTLEAQGLRVAIVPQPDWHGDYRDFKKLGRPRLFFGIAPGCMDSMVNKYTANKRLRSEDAYSPDGRHDCRPEYPTIVYTKILKELYPDVPVMLGGIEASMRRLTHYDYWQDRLRPCILLDSGADLLIYGMGEKPITELVRQMEEGRSIDTIHDIPQTVFICRDTDSDAQATDSDILLHSHEECLQNKKAQADNFRHIEEESNKIHAQRILQHVGHQVVVVNPPYPPMTTEEIDRSYDLPYTRLPHPKYKNKRIPAFEMIKFSVNIHRGCFGGCAFCTISAHQGKFISCRSKESILKEVEKISKMPDFKGYLSDLGGPSANMYGMGGRNKKACAACKRPSCINPQICPNLDTDHSKLLEIYRAVDALPYIKKSFIGSGVRYDLLLHRSKDEHSNKAAAEYTRELIVNHVSGRLKVAPEHTCPAVLRLMRKPPFELFNEFRQVFEKINKQEGLKQQIIPYFISSHPGCHEADMAELAVKTKEMDFHLEQVQDFTPTPMTVSTEAWYTGYDPYTLEPVFSAKTPKEKLAQRMFFFWYKPEERKPIEQELRRIGRADLIPKLYSQSFGFRQAPMRYEPKPYGDESKKKGKHGYGQESGSPYKKEGAAHKKGTAARNTNTPAYRTDATFTPKGDSRSYKDAGTQSRSSRSSFNPNFKNNKISRNGDSQKGRRR